MEVSVWENHRNVAEVIFSMWLMTPEGSTGRKNRRHYETRVPDCQTAITARCNTIFTHIEVGFFGWFEAGIASRPFEALVTMFHSHPNLDGRPPERSSNQSDLRKTTISDSILGLLKKLKNSSSAISNKISPCCGIKCPLYLQSWWFEAQIIPLMFHYIGQYAHYAPYSISENESTQKKNVPKENYPTKSNLKLNSRLIISNQFPQTRHTQPFLASFFDIIQDLFPEVLVRWIRWTASCSMPYH